MISHSYIGDTAGNGRNNRELIFRYPRWYFEVLSRKDAGVMLNKSIDGSYLVRPSETKPGCFSLSVKVIIPFSSLFVFFCGF